MGEGDSWRIQVPPKPGHEPLSACHPAGKPSVARNSELSAESGNLDFLHIVIFKNIGENV